MPSHKKESHPICVFCGLAIKTSDRPSVRLETGKEAHLECYAKAANGKGNSIQ